VALNIFKGKKLTPLKLVIYGDNGVGKSYFASHATKPVFLDLEGNIDHLDVFKQEAYSWTEVLGFIDLLNREEHDFKTLVIDSIDALEQLNWTDICKGVDANSITDKVKLGYGQGYALAAERAKYLLGRIEKLRQDRKMNIILIGHQAIKKIDNPEVVEYDLFCLRVNEKFASLVSDWSHTILFANYEMYTTLNEKGERMVIHAKDPSVESDQRKRVLYTTGTSSVLAKNVFNLPQKLPLDWKVFSQHVSEFFKQNPEKGEE